MTEIKTLNVMGYHILAEDINVIKIDYGTKKVINTINPHSYVVAKKDMVFQWALKKSDLLLPDGSGKVLAAKHINREKIKKIAGSDLHMHLLKALNAKGGSCFYMGAREGTLKKIEARLNKEFPAVKVGFYSPPYRESFSKKESREIVARVNAFNPDVLFIGLTAPKQEKWLYEHKNALNFNVACCIGAVFDFYAQTVKRPSKFWVDRHLEWLPRLFGEPKRMWRRNFISTPIFLKDIMLYKWGVKGSGTK